jgi:hypothetical protein
MCSRQGRIKPIKMATDPFAAIMSDTLFTAVERQRPSTGQCAQNQRHIALATLSRVNTQQWENCRQGRQMMGIQKCTAIPCARQTATKQHIILRGACDHGPGGPLPPKAFDNIPVKLFMREIRRYDGVSVWSISAVNESRCKWSIRRHGNACVISPEITTSWSGNAADTDTTGKRSTM